MGLVVCTKVLFLPFLPPPFPFNRLRFQYTAKTKKSKVTLHGKATLKEHMENNREKFWEESREFPNEQKI